MQSLQYRFTEQRPSKVAVEDLMQQWNDQIEPLENATHLISWLSVNGLGILTVDTIAILSVLRELATPASLSSIHFPKCQGREISMSRSKAWVLDQIDLRQVGLTPQTTSVQQPFLSRQKAISLRRSIPVICQVSRTHPSKVGRSKFPMSAPLTGASRACEEKVGFHPIHK